MLTTAANQPLAVEELELSLDERPLIEELRSDQFVARCPCDAAAAYLLRQKQTYAVLTQFAKSGRLACVPNDQIDQLRNRERSHLEPIDPERTIDEVTFLRTELLNFPIKLLDAAAVEQFFSVAALVRHFFPSYKIGPRLRNQDGSDFFRRDLQRAFLFLSSLGLVSRELVRERYSHSSIILIMRRALGLPMAYDAVPFIENPAGFISRAVLGVQSSAVRRKALEERLWDASGLSPSVRDDARQSPFVYDETSRRSLLARAARGHREMARSLAVTHLQESFPPFDLLPDRNALSAIESVMENEWLGAEILMSLEGGPLPLEHFLHAHRASRDAILHAIVRLASEHLVEMSNGLLARTTLGSDLVRRIDTVIDGSAA